MFRPGLTNALVRFLVDDQEPRKPAGAGFLVSSRHLLTCAHVVADALGLARDVKELPAETVYLDFPLLTHHPVLQAQVLHWYPVKETSSVGELEDIAVLELVPETPRPDAARATPIIILDTYAFFDREVRMCGFPEGMDNGDWVSGNLQGPIQTGWIQLDHELGRRGVAPGFSGTAVWDKQENAVAGMVVSIHSRAGDTSAYMIPVSTLMKAWPDLDQHSRPPNPYQGLQAFREQDAAYFFGREEGIRKLQQKVQENPFTVVIGASGSGKSSLVFAGLVPRLREEESWKIVHFRPQQSPFYQLALCVIPLLHADPMKQAETLETLPAKFECGKVGLAGLLQLVIKNEPDTRLLVIVDQFEELYTLTPDNTLQRRFIDCLLHSVQNPDRPPQFTLLLSMRADFMGQAVAYAPFANVLNTCAHEIVEPMSESGLRAAIEQPAQKLGVSIESGLTARILEDVGQEPGNLPLLEFALTQLWERQISRQLTHEAYTHIGGVEQALARYADDVYTSFEPEQQERLHQIFVQLVRPGEEGTEDTRQIATHEQVGAKNWELVTTLAGKRLVVTGRNEETGEETVEVVHEALIRHWQPLRDWMEVDREFRVWQNRLRQAMQEWESTGKDEGGLLRGARLTEAEEKMHERGDTLNARERIYIEESITLREREQKQRERTRRLRELDEREPARRRRARFLGIVKNLLLGSVIFAVLLLSLQQDSDRLQYSQDAAIDWMKQLFRGDAQDDTRGTPSYVFLDIDEATYRAWDEPLFTPRNKLLQLIRFAVDNNARIVLVDIDFSYQNIVENNNPQQHLHPYDQALYEYFYHYSETCSADLEARDSDSHCPQIILARSFRWSLDDSGEESYPEVRASFLDNAVAYSPDIHWGSILFTKEHDQSIRYQRLWEPACSETGQPKVVSSMQLLAAAFIKQPYRLPKEIIQDLQAYLQPFVPQQCQISTTDESSSNHISITRLENPMKLGEGEDVLLLTRIQQRILYRMPWKLPEGEIRPAQPQVWIRSVQPILEALDAKQPIAAEWIEDSIVSIGGSFRDSSDIHRTPLGESPGTLIILDSLHSLLQYGELRSLSITGQLLIEIMLILVMSCLFIRFHSFWGMLFSSIFMYVISLLFIFLMFRSGVWLVFVIPLFGVQLRQMAAEFQMTVKFNKLRKQFSVTNNSAKENTP